MLPGALVEMQASQQRGYEIGEKEGAHFEEDVALPQSDSVEGVQVGDRGDEERDDRGGAQDGHLEGWVFLDLVHGF